MTGLTSASKYNGLRGMVVGICLTDINSRIKVRVKVHGKNKILEIKSENIKPTSELLGPCSVCKKPAKRRCGKCETTLFCSIKCMKLAWPDPHREHCRKLRKEKNSRSVLCIE